MVELRLGIVLYGGVSLAIYMNGVTRELHKLVRASERLYEKRQLGEAGEPDLSDSERVYYALLDRLSDADLVRVVIDVIAGASAGGVNGIILAKALAHDLDLEPLRRVWIEEGDVRRLSRGASRIPLSLRTAWVAGTGWLRSAANRPPFDGDRMLDLILAALDEVDRARGSAKHGTLLPKGHELELFVTITDAQGLPRRLPVHDPADRQVVDADGVNDKQHAHLMCFRYRPDDSPSDFLDNPALAFAARATSSFPGAFPPLKVIDLDRALGRRGHRWSEERRQRFLDRFFRHHQLAAPLSGLPRAERTSFIDGGLLDNKPFRPVIDAIQDRAASSEVIRRLLYVEPDPENLEKASEAQDDRPGWARTIWKALIGIRGHEPILGDLLELGRFNERVGRLRRLIDAAAAPVDAQVRKVVGLGSLTSPDGAQLESWRTQLNQRASQSDQLAYAGYARLKISSVVRHLGRTLARLLRYPEDTEHAAFVREVVRLWAEDQGLVPGGQELNDSQLRFLEAFDFGFKRRRIRFVIQRLNEAYPARNDPAAKGVDDESVGSDARSALDQLKGQLYALERRLEGTITGESIASVFGEELGALFGENVLQLHRTSLRRKPAAFFHERRDRVHALAVELQSSLTHQMKELNRDTSAVLAEMSSNPGLPSQLKETLLLAYLGFPLYDLVAYPVRHLGDVGELTHVPVVRMSPDEPTLLAPQPAKGTSGQKRKLAGAALGHFGAFFSREARENDYLWGRLDAAERLIDVLIDALAPGKRRLDVKVVRAAKRRAFDAILQAERDTLQSIQERIAELERKTQALL